MERRGTPRPTARARRKLHNRLERRGVSRHSSPGNPPALRLVLRVCRDPSSRRRLAATSSLLAGRAAPSATGIISKSVATLVQAVIHTMTFSKVKMLATSAMLALVGLLAVVGLVRGGLSKTEADPSPSLTHPAELQAGGQPSQAASAKAERLDFRVVRVSDKQPIEGVSVEVSAFFEGSWHETRSSTNAHGVGGVELPASVSAVSIVFAKDGFVPASWSWIGKEGRPVMPRTITQELRQARRSAGS